MNGWQFAYDGFDAAEEGRREALCTLGNGYFATRGALPECAAGDVHYPGTYVAGLFNRLSSTIEGREVENESMVNLPNWLTLRFRATIDGTEGPWLTPDTATVDDHHLELDLAQGVLSRCTRYDVGEQKALRVTQRRLISMVDQHLAGLETTFVAEGFDATLTVESALDGTVTNSGVPRYRDLPSQHLAPESTHVEPDGSVCLTVSTTQSRIRIAMAARTTVHANGDPVDHEIDHEERTGWVASQHTIALAADRPVTVDKVVSVFTGRDDAISEPGLEACARIRSSPAAFDDLLAPHAVAWRHRWQQVDVDPGGPDPDTLEVLRLHMFHLLQTVSRHSALLDVGVPARGLHGEAYRGHIFWDELFIFPFFSLRFPELTRSLLLYRYRRLGRARRDAREAGYRGAMYPWQSSADGREETQTLHLNPKSGRWLPDASHLQRHVNAAIAYNVWHHHQATGDVEFLRFYGGEMLIEIARFWASIATYDRSLDRYRICGVMGPDEYHEAYPDRDEPGLDDNAYTNVMAAWCLRTALEVLDRLPETLSVELVERLSVTVDELDHWDHVSRKLRICFHEAADGSGTVISQFDGFERLAELDWDGLRARHGDIARLDRVLEVEGDSPNNYQVAKQADVTMIFYLLTAEELASIFDRLGYEWDPGLIPRTVAYYGARTSHGSTLSRVVDAWVHARGDRARSWDDFGLALRSDVDDVQGGTTAEGIHLGAMAGTVDLVQRCYTGIELKDDALYLNPALPEELDHLALTLRYRSQSVRVHLTDEAARVAVADGAGPGVLVRMGHEERRVEPASDHVFHLARTREGAIRPDSPAG